MSLDTQPAAPESHLHLHSSKARLRGTDHNGAQTSLPRLEAATGVYGFPAPKDDIDQPQRVLLTLVFTDIVGSTQTAERLGDHAWCSLLSRHHSIVRAHLKVCNGREVDTAGDGFFLTFDCPSLAVRFATAVRAALKDIGIHIRAGIHAGECELVEGHVQGIAVHTAARVAHVADEGEILVSNTVRDLLAGSGLRFSGGDAQVLKGLSEPRRLFALET